MWVVIVLLGELVVVEYLDLSDVPEVYFGILGHLLEVRLEV